MPGLRSMFMRRMGPVGIALTAYDIWRRIPPRQRQQIIEVTRRHGPRIASEVTRRRRPKPR